MINVYVDADHCPVKNEVAILTHKYGVPCFFVANYGHFSSKYEGYGQWIYLDSGQDAVDFFILSRLCKGDMVITADIGFAALALQKNSIVLHPNGREYTKDTIDTALSIRYLNQKARQQKQKMTRVPPFTETDRQNFLKQCEKILSKIEGIQNFT